jgi:hypothetical protein
MLGYIRTFEYGRGSGGLYRGDELRDLVPGLGVLARLCRMQARQECKDRVLARESAGLRGHFSAAATGDAKSCGHVCTEVRRAFTMQISREKT